MLLISSFSSTFGVTSPVYVSKSLIASRMSYIVGAVFLTGGISFSFYSSFSFSIKSSFYLANISIILTVTNLSNLANSLILSANFYISLSNLGLLVPSI